MLREQQPEMNLDGRDADRMVPANSDTPEPIASTLVVNLVGGGRIELPTRI